jgi:hypothetical protein
MHPAYLSTLANGVEGKPEECFLNALASKRSKVLKTAASGPSLETVYGGYREDFELHQVTEVCVNPPREELKQESDTQLILASKKRDLLNGAFV